MRKIILSSILSLSVYYSFGQCLVGDCNDGYGIFRLENGDYYTGNWVAGARDGYGRYDWSNRAVYVGGFKFNGLHGNGTFYTASGDVISGIFEDNIFIGIDSAALPKIENSSADEKFWQLYLKADELAQQNTRSVAAAVSFSQMASKVVLDFPNNFDTYKGYARPALIERSNGWHSKITANNAQYARIYAATTERKAFYYSLLFVGSDSLAARKKYNDFVTAFQSIKLTCCNTISDTYDFTGPVYSSFTTSWLTLNTNSGFQETQFADMVIEIELSSGLANNSWRITFQVYHLKQQ